ncbi:MAG: sigma-54 dependent transcriptional regulator [Pseudomonadota bacterium]
MSRERLMIIDDEQDMLDGLRRLLGYELPELICDTFAEPRSAMASIHHSPPDLVLLDVRMPDIDGMAVLKALLRDDPWLTCIMMTAHGTIELAVAAIKSGAYDFITKPFETDSLVRMLVKGLERNRLIRENRVLRGRVEGADFHGMIGRSKAMQHLFEQIRAVAHSDYSVMIRGESGTGKELVARALHTESARNRRPFITVNCPATPENLLESELFGYRRGAFTGADKDRRGLFEEANTGTLFLDEIADIPITTQTKLLRALQDGEIKPLGAATAFKADVRILAATNQDIEEKIAARTFREDLFYRLNVVTVRTPSLIETVEDIPLLATHFAMISSKELDLPTRRFSPDALQFLTSLKWPGNVRQLQNVVRQAVMFSRQEVVSLHALASLQTIAAPAPPAGSVKITLGKDILSYKEAKDHIVECFTREYVLDLLSKTGGNVTRGAEVSGLGRPSLQKIMRRLNITSDTFRLNTD